jgi:F1F0 ATPase subunit 2
MNDPIILAGLVWAGLSGLLAGILFYGGLWGTVQKGLTAKRPELLFLGSFLLRTGIVLVLFYYCTEGRLNRLLSCLAGFTLARVVVSLVVPKPKSLPASQEGGRP